MAQVNFYIPDPLEKKLRKEAKSSGKSLSAFLAELIRFRLEREEWDPEFFDKFFGGWKGETPKIESELPEKGRSL